VKRSKLSQVVYSLTGQFADKPTRSQSTESNRGLVNSRTSQLT